MRCSWFNNGEDISVISHPLSSSGRFKPNPKNRLVLPFELRGHHFYGGCWESLTQRSKKSRVFTNKTRENERFFRFPLPTNFSTHTASENFCYFGSSYPHPLLYQPSCLTSKPFNMIRSCQKFQELFQFWRGRQSVAPFIINRKKRISRSQDITM